MAKSESNIPNDAMENLQIQMGIDRIKRLMPFFMDQQPLNAKILKSRFDSLLAEGFTEKQALEIICKRPLLE